MSRNRNTANTATISAPSAESQIETVPATTAESLLFTCERGLESISRDIVFGAHGSVEIGNKVTTDELGHFLEKRFDNQNSETVRNVNCLRHSRKLSKVRVPIFNEAGIATGATKEITALEYLKMRLRSKAETESVFNNTVQLIESVDFLADNPDTFPAKLSPFTVKNALGVLRTFGVLPPADKKADYVEGSLKMTIADTTDPIALVVIEGLKEAISQKKLADKVRDAIAAKDAAKALADAEKAKALTAGATTTKTEAGATTEATTEAGATNATTTTGATTGATTTTETATKVEYKAEAVLGMIVSAIGAWELSVQGGEKIEALRKMCADDLKKLAKLGGFKCEPLS